MHFIYTSTSRGVGCGCMVLFIHRCVVEWVMSFENGTKSKVETHDGVKPFKWQVMCVGRIWVYETRGIIRKVL